MSDEKIRTNTKVALEEMFSKKTDQSKKQQNVNSEDNLNDLDDVDLYVKKFTFPVTRGVYKDINDLFFIKNLIGPKIKKLAFFNEVLQFYIENHKHLLKKNDSFRK